MSFFKNNADRLELNQPPLFTPSVVRQISPEQGNSANSIYLNKTDSSVEDETALGVSSSFKYDPQGVGIRSTQQLNVDWSRFENHVFFNSAQVKTNVAFDKIINEFPFDGTKKETELFFDELTGFEKWVYDQFPKNRGYLFFSGSTGTSGDTAGTIVFVKDYAGAQFSTLSRNTTGNYSILEPGASTPMTIETYIYVPSQSLGDLDQAVLCKQSGSNHGFGVVLETATGSIGNATVSMLVASSSLEDKVSLTVPMGQWKHVAWVWDRTPGVNTIFGYLDKVLKSSSSMPIEFNTLNTQGKDLLVGSGSNLGTFAPTTTFSGALDELRIWHSVRSAEERTEYYQKPLFADDDLKLYFKFNEPSGSSTNLVLDYSRNSLHGRLGTRAITLGVREVPSSSVAGDSPMAQELLSTCPVLFPRVQSSVDLRTELLTSASYYDDHNPNLITRLIPAHYFDEGRKQDSLETDEGQIVEIPTTSDIEPNPRESELGATQVLLSFLYVWAKFFDEMKLFIQAFSTLDTVAYNEIDTVPFKFLIAYAKRKGIELPPLFTGASIAQFIEGDNVGGPSTTTIPSINEYSLQTVQNEVWKRILVNLRDIVASKGTIHSIKAFMRAVGISPDGVFRIREYGGPTKRSLDFVRENRFEVSTMIDFVSGGLLESAPLFGSSRTEPGLPQSGPNVNDNKVLTSGSFTFEGTYRFPVSQGFLVSQSLASFRLSGSTSEFPYVAMNTVAVVSGGVTLYAQPNVSGTNAILSLPITGADLFDGSQWYVSFGRRRNDDGLSSGVSSSYFLRLAKQQSGEIIESYATSSYFFDDPATSSMWQSYWGAGNNPQYINIGSSSFGVKHVLLNAGTGSLKVTDFQGKVGQIRFWSKYLADDEWPEHVKNFRSVGVVDPRKNFNFVTSASGSWQRLRIDASTDQIDTTSDASGLIDLTDFTQNYMGFSGSGFLASTTVITPERFNYSFISPRIDEGAVNNKVRVRGFLDETEVLDTPWAQLAPAHDVNPVGDGSVSSDSTKISIDFSVTDALDQDILTIFSTLDEMSSIIGNPELQYSEDYKELAVLRDVYFNKLEGKINLKSFFEFFKWFDANIGNFVESLLPRKSRFLGTNYEIRNHFLERGKIQDQNEEGYIDQDKRNSEKGTDSISNETIESKVQQF